MELDVGEFRLPVLTDNGMAFADLPKNCEGPSRRFLGPHIFDRVCIENGIEHRLTKPYHPWTNGQAERMNRTIKDATVKVFHYEDLESLKAHVLAFVTAYNFAKHLKALRWRTPYQIPWGLGLRPSSDRVRSLANHLEATMLRKANNTETETSIRTDLRAIFVSLELSRTIMVGHPAIPGHAGEDVKALRVSR